jgi:vancomycin resistance protein YoaR
MNYRIKNSLYILLTIITVLVILGLGFYVFLQVRYDNRIYPGISINNIDLGGQTMAEAKKNLESKANELLNNDLKFTYRDRTVNIAQESFMLNIDNARPVLTIDYNQALKEAYNYGRSGQIIPDIQNRVKAFFNKKTVALPIILDQEILKPELIAKFQDMETSVVESSLTINSPESDFTYEIIEGKAGENIDYDLALNELKNNLNKLKNVTITLTSKKTEPKIIKATAPDLKNEIAKYLEVAPFSLVYTDVKASTTDKYKITKASLAGWLDLKLNDNKIQVGLNNDKIKEYLTEKIAPQVNIELKEARFEIKNGRVAAFQTGDDGLEINVEETVKNLENYFTDPKNQEVALAVTIIKNEGVKVADNTLLVKEIIGTGTSNFSGSPKNRLHNIRTGAAAVNGLLIKPGEEFSLVKAIGEVEASTGYLPELVIKENKTIPEYGGGLCQVGTTMFRAALQSGLPITSRRNHSYRVSYYEPAGMDAAIYIPQPDVRFINDTGNYILIQVRFSGSNIYFDFWGVKDDRQIKITKPVVYNIVKPAPAKIIESTDIPVGTKKCTEKAHNGADAWFNYTVTYNPGKENQEVKEKKFSSHYVPWQEVCLIGVKSLSSTSTPAVIAPVTSTTTTATTTTVN